MSMSIHAESTFHKNLLSWFREKVHSGHVIKFSSPAWMSKPLTCLQQGSLAVGSARNPRRAVSTHNFRPTGRSLCSLAASALALFGMELVSPLSQ